MTETHDYTSTISRNKIIFHNDEIHNLKSTDIGFKLSNSIKSSSPHKNVDTYKRGANNKKIKEVRVEALRAGFKQCYEYKDFNTIVLIGDKIPNDLLMEDEGLLLFYDIAFGRV